MFRQHISIQKRVKKGGVETPPDQRLTATRKKNPDLHEIEMKVSADMIVLTFV
jgi:hypothetical protein